MKLSYQWLQEWIALRIEARALAERLTLAGLEVGAIEPVAAPLDRVIVGRVREVAPHPTVERLTVCEVEVARGKTVRVVCGAPNVAPGIKAPLALPGAVLANERRIETSSIQGIESQGMLCSAAELGLEAESIGLLVLDAATRTGTPIVAALGLADVTLELELTPNRGDCLSVAGVAREVAALTGARLRVLAIRKTPVKVRKRVPVKVSAKKECPRYAGRVVQNIDPAATTPLWMRERLRRAGVRSLHPVVDVTNYVMLELGQPMHAFDLDRLRGAIHVRSAGDGDALTLLDGRQLTAPKGSLLITDDRGAIALAGIMGGEDTAVGTETRSVFLESAFFDPDIVARHARALGLQTESSQRFERGVDPELQQRALERATVLLREIAGGEPGPISEVAAKRRAPAPVTLRAARLTHVLGCEIPRAKVEQALQRLGMKIQRRSDGWRVMAPSHRFDINIEVDLIEEVARVTGYAAVPAVVPMAPTEAPEASEAQLTYSRLRALLVDRDYQEVITYSFVDPQVQQRLDPATTAFTLANPISADMAVMRTTLWPGLLQALGYNRNRQQARVRLFEIGRRFLSGTNPKEEPVLAGVAAGDVAPEQWGLPARDVDFYDVKADVEASLALGNSEPRFVPVVHPALHPGQSAAIHVGGEIIGYIGTLHPALQVQLQTGKVVLFELLLAALTERRVPVFAGVSRFPAVRRDLSIVVSEATSAQAVLNTVRDVAGNLLANLHLFDVYRGEGIDSGRKSLALGLTFQDSSRTLREAEVDALETQVIAALKEKLGGNVRGGA